MEGITEKQLFNCRVKYIGTSEPTRKVQGVEAVQEPLRSVYGHVDNDIDKFTLNAIDAGLTVLESGLQLNFIADQGHVVVFPISSLFYCSALRFCPYNAANQPVDHPMFVFLDSNDADAPHNEVHPPIFSVIFQRNRGRNKSRKSKDDWNLLGRFNPPPCMECHSFVCATTSSALQLVEACQNAYNKPEHDFLIKDSKYPYFYRHEGDGDDVGEIIEIPNKALSRISTKTGSSLSESFFYGTSLTPVVEFAFNPDFLRRAHGIPTHRRTVGGATYNNNNFGGAAYNNSNFGGAAYTNFASNSFVGEYDSISRAGGGVLRNATRSAPSGSVVRRVVLQPGEIPPHMEPEPDYQQSVIVKRKP